MKQVEFYVFFVLRQNVHAAPTYAYPSRQEGQLTVFLGPLAGWKPAAETRSIARVRDSESMNRIDYGTDLEQNDPCKIVT